jgi:protein O-GlcNAc transferase
MFACPLKMRLPAGFLLAALPALSCMGQAQEPSTSLKQADTDYRSGVAALSSNDLNTALADFEKVVHLAPAIEQGHSALGTVYLRLGRTSEGIRELKKALALQPSDRSAMLNLALAYEQSGEAAEALPWFAKLEAASRVDKQALPLNVLVSYARALAAARQFPAAVARMKEAIARDSQNAEWQDELGSIYAQQQSWPEARQAFTAALQLNPDLAMAHMHLGITLQAEQQPGALDELAKAYQLAPQNPEVAMQFGQALASAGQDEQAIPLFEHALEVDPGLTAATYQLGLALQRTNKLEDALPLLQKAAAADPKDAEVLTNLGMALCQAQQAKDAVPILQRAVALMPGNLTAHQDLAAAYIQLSQFDDSISQLREALKLSPNAPQLHYNLGLAFKMQDDAAHAIPEFETAEKLDPSAPEPPYALGMLYVQAGRYTDAERELNISLKLRPENGDEWSTLGSVYSHLDKLPEAASALREAIRQLPQQPDPHLTLAAVLVKQNQPAEAAAERKQAAELMRSNMNRQRAEVASNSGNSLLKSGKVNEAIVEFRDAVSYDANYAEAHMGLAKALEQQGKVVEAATERQKAEALEKTSQAQQVQH